MKRLTKKQKRVTKRFVKRGAKMGVASRKLKAAKKKVQEDIFLDDNSKVDLEDAVIINPSRHDVLDEISSLDSFRDYARESRGNGLTFGDY